MVTALKIAAADQEEKTMSLFEIAHLKKELFDDGDWIESEHITDDGIRLIQTGNIGVGNFVEKDNKKFIFQESFSKLKCKELRVGDLLICRLAEPAGRACVLPDIGFERVVTSVDVTIFRPPTNVANRNFLSALFSTDEWFKAVSDRSGGTTHKRISRGALGKIKIKLPHIHVQNIISDIFNDLDGLIGSLEQVITKKSQIKQGLMQDLLTGKRRLEGFRQPWARRRIGELLTIKHGKSQRNVEDRNGLYPILATGGQIGQANKFLWDKPSVLIGRKGTIDRPQYANTPFWTVDTLFYSDVHDENCAKFIFYRFCLIDWLIHNEASGVPSLNAKTIENIEIDTPEPDEQRAIVSVISSMDSEIDELSSRVVKARQIKQGMMQQLLTGRVSLV